VVAVVLLPVLVLWHRDNVLFTPARHTDPWFYLGFFRNLANFKRDLFPGIYYGSRLAWILPGYMVHKLFAPVTAAWILHLGVHTAAALSCFAILQITAGARTALLGTMVFSVNPWLWAATGWDYVSGPGIAWTLAGLAFLTHAAAHPSRKWSLFAAGVALAGMVHTTFFLLAFTPLLPLYYVGMTRASWRQAALFCLWAGAGFVTATAALCAVNYRLDGHLWFWTPSIAASRTLTTTFKWPKLAIFAGGRLVAWLWFPALSIVTAMALLPGRLKQEFKGANAAALLLSADLLLASAYLVYQQSRGIPALGYYFHSSYVMPFVFLVIGISFWPAVDAMSAGVYAATCLAAAAAFGALWFDLPATDTNTMIVLAALALAVGLVLRQRPAGAWVGLAGFAILTAQAGAGTAELHGSSAEYARTMAARDRVETFRRGGVVRFWFDDKDPASLDYWALNNSYLAEFTQINTSFPRNGCDAAIEPETLIVVSSSLQDAAGIAQRTLADCWRPSGMKPAILAVDPMKRDSLPYSMILLRTEADPSLRRPLRVVIDGAGKGSLELVENGAAAVAFPREKWRVSPHPTDPPVVRDTANGVIVRTPQRAYAFALEYPPLTVPADGRYRFSLRYWPIAGQFEFGARPADDSRYLAGDAVGHPVAGGREMNFWLDLKRGEIVLLRIANNNNYGDGAASFVMGEVTAVYVRPRP
jgi:hypothetical protein